MPLSLSELIETYQSKPAAAQSTTSWGAKRRREDRGPEKPRSAGATATMAPSNTHIHVFTQADTCLVTAASHTHASAKRFTRRGLSQLILKPTVCRCQHLSSHHVCFLRLLVRRRLTSLPDTSKKEMIGWAFSVQHNREQGTVSASFHKRLQQILFIKKQPSYKTVLPFLLEICQKKFLTRTGGFA